MRKKKTNNKSENDRINKYLKNINLIKKLINNKNTNNEKTFNKETSVFLYLK